MTEHTFSLLVNKFSASVSYWLSSAWKVLLKKRKHKPFFPWLNGVCSSLELSLSPKTWFGISFFNILWFFDIVWLKLIKVVSFSLVYFILGFKRAVDKLSNESALLAVSLSGLYFLLLGNYCTFLPSLICNGVYILSHSG